ncbi:hypothetical protein DEU56DRAFT_984518 [Suillus clintonianus]|uniref:uncharacterized protein n=1 Tax=Suillus clintonianus TaxID=1904413 RepID=UPI001B87C488|nr:uncharacterized protein DEU56DRAFT_984518 [Suillus clintonianus]KAG2119438.1 hypothetical protein DEU56DRAFT_984518 [Suillus clintonianus]
MSLFTGNRDRTVPRALLVYEIFSNIISYIKTENPASFKPFLEEPEPTLFALALTCHALTEQALDALWDTLPSIEPLMRCAGIIPSPKERPKDGKGCSIIPTEAQLAVISRYAHRVRSLRLDTYRVRFLREEFADRDGHMQAFLRILACSSKVPVPNLRSLFVDFLREPFHLIYPLLGPRLQHLSISIYHNEPDDHPLHTVLPSLPCPSLESLKFEQYNYLDYQEVVPCALPVSHDILQQMQKLRIVDVPSIAKDALTFLGGLSSVTNIRTHLPTSSDLEDILGSSRGLEPVLFENIDSVDWEIKEWRDVEAFAHLWPSKLTSISLRSEVKLDPSLLQVLFDSLHTREAFRNLQCICLSEPSGPTLSISKVITIDTIRPLLYLSHLQVVDIDTMSSLSIGDSDLEEIAKGWPCLEVLLLNKDYGFTSSAAPKPRWISVPGVVRFVESLPCLKKLAIGITLRTVKDDYDMKNLDDLEPRDSDSRLEDLTMRYPREEDYIWEACYPDLDLLFTKLFPKVDPEVDLFSDTYC